jgi:hypothetical protein
MDAAEAGGALFRSGGAADARLPAGPCAKGRRSAFLRLPSWINPWLIESALRGRRGFRAGSWLPAGAFTAAAYLLAMNNRTPGDRAQVLFALTCGFSFVVAWGCMSLLSPDRLRPEWVHGLPAEKTHLAVSSLASGLSVLAPVTGAFLALLAAAGTPPPVLGGFFLKSACSALLFLWPACACGLGSYPDAALGRRRFLAWTLGLILLSALFYRYLTGVLLAMAALPVWDFRRARLYRSAEG